MSSERKAVSIEVPLQAPAPATSISGVIEFGQLPRIVLGNQLTTWPELIRAGELEIAIDGHFVLDDRLYLGRTREERQFVGQLLREDIERFLPRLQNAYFNAIVNDYERRETRFFNDHYGGLPLYLARRTDRVYFSSTYAGLRQLGLREDKHDSIGIAEQYWIGYQLGDRTALQDVQVLPASSQWTIRWQDGHLQTRQMQRPMRRKISFRTIDEAAEHVTATAKSVAKRLHRSDVGVGIKVSGGMDSRLICGTWPDDAVHTYTYGYRGSAEVRCARQLALALGMNHRYVPIEGDFFSKIHAPLFALHGMTEFFHQAAVPAMKRDGVDVVLDGLAGGNFVGGQSLKHGQAVWRQALGLAAESERDVPTSDEAMAEYIFKRVRLPDVHYRPVVEQAHRALTASIDDILHNLVLEVRKAKEEFEVFDDIFTDVIYRNRTRRYISLQGTLCRPYVETLYPFLDRDFLDLRGTIPPEWIANKRLYVEIYTKHLPAIRGVPGLFSLLPFNVPTALHFPGRAVRYGIEQLGLRISYGTRNVIRPWASNGVQWARWLAFDDEFREGARRFMLRSPVFDDAAFQRDTREVARGPKFSATRFMMTASYCGHFVDQPGPAAQTDVRTATNREADLEAIASR